MSKSEDYLDQLLDGMETEESLEEDFLSDDDFLDEDFLKEFEMEMEKLDKSEELEETGNAEDVLSLFDGLDNILNGEKEPDVLEELTAEPAISVEEPMVAEVEEEPEVPMAEEGFSFANLFASEGEESKETVQEEDADVLKILEGLEGIDLELDQVEVNQSANEQSDFSALEGFLATSAAASGNADASNTEQVLNEDVLSGLNLGDDAEGTASDTDEQTKKKEKKTGEKEGFMNKLGLILFGEDEEEDEETIEDLIAKEKKEQEKKEKKEQREKAKQERKEKREKAKLEREAKAAERKKEKKPKPPKEPDNTPPLPKKPVFLIFLMVGSFIALVVLGADLLGYSNQIENAKNQYAKKNYSEAFAEIAGMEIKGEDFLLYNKYHVMAMVSAELEAYESLMSKELYDMALDCLVRTVGRAEKYREDAETYGCIQELDEVEAKAAELLKDIFDLSKEEALEIYAHRSKKEYSTAILKVIKELGLEK